IHEGETIRGASTAIRYVFVVLCCAAEVVGTATAPRPPSGGMRGGPSFDYLIRPREQRGRNRQAEGLGGLEVDDELELGWLFDRQVGRLRALEDLIDEGGCASSEIRQARPVRHEGPGLHVLPEGVCCRQAAPCRKVCEPCAVENEHGVG